MTTKNIIVHGDSRDYIPSISTPINLVLTDPPYGMDYASNSAQTPHGKEYTKRIQNDMTIPEAIELFYSVMGPIIAKMADDSDLYIFTAHHILEWWIPAVRNLTFLREDGILDNRWVMDGEGKEKRYWPERKLDHGIRYKQLIVWDKQDVGQGDLASWGCGHEVALYLKKGRRPVNRRRSAIVSCPRIPAGQNIHPTEKPVPLLRTLIETSTDPGDFVVDPFSGSGSTSKAAQETGRNSLAFEIDERFIAKSQERLNELSIFNA